MAGVAEVAAAGAAGILAIVGAGQLPISADYKIGQLARGGPTTGVLGANRAGIDLIVVAEPIHQGAGGVIEIDLIGAAEVVGGTTDHFDAIRQAPGTAECGGSAFGENHRFTWINDAKTTQILGSRGAAIVIKAPASHVHCIAGEVGEFNEFSWPAGAVVHVFSDLNAAGTLFVVGDVHRGAHRTAAGVITGAGQAQLHIFATFN